MFRKTQPSLVTLAAEAAMKPGATRSSMMSADDSTIFPTPGSPSDKYFAAQRIV
jgi:hypothetical protein